MWLFDFTVAKRSPIRGTGAELPIMYRLQYLGIKKEKANIQFSPIIGSDVAPCVQKQLDLK